MPTDSPEDSQRRLAKLLIESNTDRMPGDLERGLIALFSTLEVTGIRITVGKPVSAAEARFDFRSGVFTVSAIEAAQRGQPTHAASLSRRRGPAVGRVPTAI
jgi:hypothetical protein